MAHEQSIGLYLPDAKIIKDMLRLSLWVRRVDENGNASVWLKAQSFSFAENVISQMGPPTLDAYIALDNES